MNDILISEIILLIFSLVVFIVINFYHKYKLLKIKNKVYKSWIKDDEYIVSQIFEIK